MKKQVITLSPYNRGASKYFAKIDKSVIENGEIMDFVTEKMFVLVGRVSQVTKWLKAKYPDKYIVLREFEHDGDTYTKYLSCYSWITTPNSGGWL